MCHYHPFKISVGKDGLCKWLPNRKVPSGVTILEASGGKIMSLDDKELIYGNKDQDYFNPEFIASNF